MSANAHPLPRRIALRVLRNLHQRLDGGIRAFSNRLLDQELERYPELAKRDRGLITVLVYGVLRHCIRLDACIDRAAKAPNKIKGEVREALRMAAFEILELERPLAIASAEAAKTLRSIDPSGRLRPVIGGILRTIAQDVKSWEVASDDPIAWMHQRYSLPLWLAKRWFDTLGPQRALDRAKACLETPRVDLRVDISRTTLEAMKTSLLVDHPGISIEEVNGAPQTLSVRGGSDLFYGPLHEAGLISVQSQGSSAAGLALAPRAGERILDACCGMGTKLLHLAEQMQRRGEIVGCDSNALRLQEIETLRQRGKIDGSALRIEVVNGDLCDEQLDLGGDFDGVLLDAPCTGLGNLARHPELRLALRAPDIEICAELQRRLLRACLHRVRDGGRLVYSVCSLEPEEGRDQIAAIMRDPPANLALELAEEGERSPEEHGCDGLYWAKIVVRRSSAAPEELVLQVLGAPKNRC